MTNNRLKIVKHSLSTHADVARWPDVLANLDENFDDLPIPPDISSRLVPGDWISDSDGDEIAHAQATPEMRAGLSRSQRQMLANLDSEVRNEADPLLSARVMARMATLIAFGDIPVPLVLSTFAQAAMGGDPQPFHNQYYFAHLHLLDFRDQATREGKPATPAFNCDEYGAMATYIHNQGLEALTALNERDFFDNDERISTHSLNAIIDARLRICSIWDPNRGVSVAVSNRLINEVRGAMARMWPRLSDSRHDGSEKSLSLAGPRYAQRVASFGDDRTCLDADAWTLSATLWQEWLAFCSARSEPSGTSSTFFKELMHWSGGRIQRSKKGPDRVPGYSGIKIICDPHQTVSAPPS
ncbi:hypothetical protein ABIA00_004364 [Bradyrhizobium ottawaense]|uniref:hypothetical protein n=1 Tax=Bradyrhizobium ottawaense TaxID=931866 RepID=UPI0038349D8C